MGPFHHKRSVRHVVSNMASVGLLLLAVGCMGQTKMAKLQEAASDLNMATRFGRMDVATERVSPKDLEGFARRHAAWGGSIRIVDVEYRGIQIVDDNTAVVFVAVGWQQPDDPNLRVTQLAQQWEYGQGGWKLKDETRNAGDVGLLGETTEYLRPESRPDVHYPSITIR
ncbi:MAG TPA: hypothetical protein PKL73_16850 [Polyangiaceae bacterium]|jgi:hypothetical protein|nr:MAG: hypothetical protein BWY17_03665 [Deltaproteobacteria bacterium ADurb.Bin207]HNS98625.1 hypothetical protein [Polyangiaceae bacterium]HNZ24671.1 hypothetical protein [Polyangiaceae bacterium]HOD23447.1 hypothetical protein [Polyangiaceae bacterium]HOE50015.1 hypothetical protein [Polyangiaceae bacterium]